jgi:hypothetical protein
MLQSNKPEIERILITNLVRIFTAYGWVGEETPCNHTSKIETIRYGLNHGEALEYKTHLARLIQVRRIDHKYGLFTLTFLEGTLSLLNSYANNNKLFNKIATPLKKRPKFELSVSNGNVFLTVDHAKAAVKRMNSFDASNIRYSLVEEYGLDRLKADLAVVAPGATIVIDYEGHTPDQLREWLYDDNLTKMTVMFPVLPIVTIKRIV